MRRPLPMLLVGLALLACTPSTTLVVNVELRSDDPSPAAIRVSVFNRYRALLWKHVVANPVLPGAMVVRASDQDERLRIVVEGDSTPPTLGSVTAEMHTHARIVRTLVLATDTHDS